MSTKEKKKWYKTSWGVIILLVIFYPIGLFFMWKETKWPKKVKWGVTAFYASLFFITSIATSTKPENVSRNQTTVPASAKVEDTNSASTGTPKVVEKYNIVVTNKIVKKVDGKYRYFFDIRNHDTKPFEGSVIISLFTSELKNPIAGDTFNTTKLIDPALGTVVYIDANTGPTDIHGKNGISNYSYTVKKGNETVNIGEGIIVNSFEDTDAYFN